MTGQSKKTPLAPDVTMISSELIPNRINGSSFYTQSIAEVIRITKGLLSLSLGSAACLRITDKQIPFSGRRRRRRRRRRRWRRRWWQSILEKRNRLFSSKLVLIVFFIIIVVDASKHLKATEVDWCDGKSEQKRDLFLVFLVWMIRRLTLYYGADADADADVGDATMWRDKTRRASITPSTLTPTPQFSKNWLKGM